MPTLFEAEDQVNFESKEHDVTVTSLTDRRRIKALETQVEDLAAKLAAASGRVKPGLTKVVGAECRHHGSYEVSDHNLEVRCNDCNLLVDPYMVLRQIAHREVNFCYALNALRDESKLLTKQNQALKAKRARLRAQLTKETPDTPIDRVAEIMRSANAEAFGVQRIGGSWAATMKLRDDKRVVTSYMQSGIELAVDRLMQAVSGTAEEIAE